MRRTFALTAALAAVLSTAPAARATHTMCTALAGTLTTPTFHLTYYPGLPVAGPLDQTLVTSGLGGYTLNATCVTATGARTATAAFGFTSPLVYGASLLPATYASGLEYVDYWSVTAAATVVAADGPGGGYDRNARVSASVLTLLSRQAGVVAVETYLLDLTVDADGAGPLPGENWGSPSAAGLSAYSTNAALVGDLMRPEFRISDLLIPSTAGALVSL